MLDIPREATVDSAAMEDRQLKIRDSFATLNGDITEYVMPSGSLEIIAWDDRTLFAIALNEDGGITVSSGHCCKHAGKILDSPLQIEPRASNVVTIRKTEHTPSKP